MRALFQILLARAIALSRLLCSFLSDMAKKIPRWSWRASVAALAGAGELVTTVLAIENGAVARDSVFSIFVHLIYDCIIMYCCFY